jgi:hypothetical protein
MESGAGETDVAVGWTGTNGDSLKVVEGFDFFVYGSLRNLWLCETIGRSLPGRLHCFCRAFVRGGRMKLRHRASRRHKATAGRQIFLLACCVAPISLPVARSEGGQSVSDAVLAYKQSRAPIEARIQVLMGRMKQEEKVRQQSGWLPSFPSMAGEQSAMIWHHAAAYILHACIMCYRNFHVEEAYRAIRKNKIQATMVPCKHGPLTSLDCVYFHRGFFLALAKVLVETVPQVTVERCQAVPVTLETSSDDWCVAQLAKALGKQDDYARFMKLAHNSKCIRSDAWLHDSEERGWAVGRRLRSEARWRTEAWHAGWRFE